MASLSYTVSTSTIYLLVRESWRYCQSDISVFSNAGHLRALSARKTTLVMSHTVLDDAPDAQARVVLAACGTKHATFL